MPVCPGRHTTPNKAKCNSLVRRCFKCGTVGCSQPKEDGCTNQNFYLGKCLSCGAAGHDHPLV